MLQCPDPGHYLLSGSVPLNLAIDNSIASTPDAWVHVLGLRTRLCRDQRGARLFRPLPSWQPWQGLEASRSFRVLLTYSKEQWKHTGRVWREVLGKREELQNVFSVQSISPRTPSGRQAI